MTCYITSITKFIKNIPVLSVCICIGLLNINGIYAQTTVTTNDFYTRGANTVFCKASFEKGADDVITERGICWSETPNPSIEDNTVSEPGSSPSEFLLQIKDLTPNTKYHVKSYVKTSEGAYIYGNEIKVKTLRKGSMSYTVNQNSSVPEAMGRINNASKEAVEYFNNFTGVFNKHITISYNSGVQTADANYAGNMRVGPNASYQRTGTIIHELAHTVGSGTSNSYWEMMVDGRWKGKTANKILQFMDSDPDAYLKGDATHFWPYGINGAHEDTGEEMLYIMSCLVVQGMIDDGLLPPNAVPVAEETLKAEAGQKYYLKSLDTTKDRDTAFLVDDGNGKLVFKTMTADEALNDEHAAWYVSFDEVKDLYSVQNVATQKYIKYDGSFSGEGTAVSDGFITDSYEEGENEDRYWFQLSESDTVFSEGDEDANFSVKAYALIADKTGHFQALDAYSTASTGSWPFGGRSKVNQHWCFFKDSEIAEFEDALNAPYAKKFRLEEDAIYTIQPYLNNAIQDMGVGVRTTDLNTARLLNYDSKDELQQWKITQINGTPEGSETENHYLFMNLQTGRYLKIEKTGVATLSEYESENLNHNLRILFSDKITDRDAGTLKIFSIENDNTIAGNSQIFCLDNLNMLGSGQKLFATERSATIKDTQRWLIKRVGSTTAIESIESNTHNTLVYSREGYIIVENKSPNQIEATIYSAGGRQIIKTTKTEIPVSKGFYIVKAGSEVHKIIVR